jgi:hypothetical protein
MREYWHVHRFEYSAVPIAYGVSAGVAVDYCSVKRFQQQYVAGDLHVLVSVRRRKAGSVSVTSSARTCTSPQSPFHYRQTLQLDHASSRSILC